ncbi:MAG: phosphoglycerate kinase [Candidatus Moranbacteria bacterium]|nr:phosphoglycerate kinase [Candidatus Moranbacteria bacterium]
MRKIQEVNLENKKVLLRVDFNVELENEDVMEKFKIKSCCETVEHILGQKGAKLALVSHLGRPEGKVDEKYSLRQIIDDVENILGRKIKFAESCIDEEVKKSIEELKEGEVLLLENVRFYPGEDPVKFAEAADHGAEKNYEEFSKALAKPFDIFVNDAFSVCHRDQASVTGVTKFLPSYAGLRLQKEIENLSKVRNNPDRPAVAIIGGAKIETKLPLIRNLEKTYDHVLVGGKIATEAQDQHVAFSKKVILPSDYINGRRDIGGKTIQKFTEIIETAKTLVWNGPLGKFEEKPFDNGTKKILEAVIASQSFSLVGGGESVQVLEENAALDQISFVSTGGGAMLEYLSGISLPGIKVLMV